LRHRFWYGLSERVRWSRGTFREAPALQLPPLPVERSRRIAALQERYQVRFESELGVQTSLNNYEYLDILDHAWPDHAWPDTARADDAPPDHVRADSAPLRPQGMERLCDVGCASFWYAAALDAFFRPRAMVGVDVEGYRLFRDGRTRGDYAAGYVGQRPNARFVVADYVTYRESADVITAWFPFLTPGAILAWRLPLSLLEPERLVRQIHHNLKRGGTFLMVNHGVEEAASAHRLCIAAGFELAWQCPAFSPLSLNRMLPPVVSSWRHSPGSTPSGGSAAPPHAGPASQ
jgi:SAM-dependent methyltransferase